MDTILVVDADRRMLAELGEYLGQAGFEADLAGDGLSGLRAFYEKHPALVILGCPLNGMDGWTLAARIREVSDTPLIMVHREGEDEALRAFKLGADAFVGRPFACEVMVAHVEAVLKRAHSNGTGGRVVTTGDLTIDLSRRRVLKNGRTVRFTPTEFRLLAVLACHAGRPLSLEYLVSEVWGPGYEGEFGYVKRYVWALRKKLEDDPASPTYLTTERGFGYRLEQIHTVSTSSTPNRHLRLLSYVKDTHT